MSVHPCPASPCPICTSDKKQQYYQLLSGQPGQSEAAYLQACAALIMKQAKEGKRRPRELMRAHGKSWEVDKKQREARSLMQKHGRK